VTTLVALVDANAETSSSALSSELSYKSTVYNFESSVTFEKGVLKF